MPAVGVPTADLTESFVSALVLRQTATDEAAATRETEVVEAVAAGMTDVAAAGSEKFYMVTRVHPQFCLLRAKQLKTSKTT